MSSNFDSSLSEGWQRFLAHVIEHGLSRGRRAPEDFIRHFPPHAIMNALSSQSKLRSHILVIATGVRPAIAERKSPQSAGEDLQISLDEGETDAETVVALFTPDDRVRYCDPQKLWSYVTEGAFWEADPRTDSAAHAIAREHVTFMLERALRDGLITFADIVEGITVEKMAQLLPRAELGRILAAALAAGRQGKAFTERALLEQVPCSTIMDHVPLATVWRGVLHPRVAEAFNLAGGSAPEAREAADARAMPESGPAPKQEDEDDGDIPVELEATHAAPPVSETRRIEQATPVPAKPKAPPMPPARPAVRAAK